MRMPTVLKYKNCDKSKISELLTVDRTWMYKFEPQSRVNNKQWLCKDQATCRPAIVKEQKTRKKVLYALFLNSDWPIV